MKALLFSAFVALLLVGCSGSSDEGGVSTATPADKLDRPAPTAAAGGAASSVGLAR